MTTYYLQIDSFDDGPETGTVVAGDCTARISTPKEDGQPTRGPLSWLNSARVVVDEADDAVHLLVSVDDPRGALCFTVRRTPKGLLMIHMPTACEPNTVAAHVDGLRQNSTSALVVTNSSGADRDFSDDDPGGDDYDDE